MNRTHEHSYFSVKHTTLGHQVLIFYHMFLYVQEGIQRVRFLTHQNIYNKTLAPDTWILYWSTRVIVQKVLLVYWGFSFENKIPITYLIQYLDNLCVPAMVYCTFLHKLIYFDRKLFLIDYIFWIFDQSHRNGCTIS